MDRKEAIRKYKDSPPPAGVFRVRNTVSGKSLVGSSKNLPAVLNRERFQLQHGSHPDRGLQKDWNELGAEAFQFEILDQLEPSSDPAADLTEDLKTLLQMWLQKLSAAGEQFYERSGRIA